MSGAAVAGGCPDAPCVESSTTRVTLPTRALVRQIREFIRTLLLPMVLIEEARSNRAMLLASARADPSRTGWIARNFEWKDGLADRRRSRLSRWGDFWGR